MATASQEACRFNDLLNPIRDLAKNWDVDIAFHLEEYLAELEMIAITFDGGKTSMNFAEAALLIQGSACVYSKKVDFLYNLVMQLLDVLRSRKTQQQDGVHISRHRAVDSEQFLALDDYSFPRTADMKQDDNIAKLSSLLQPEIPAGVITHKNGDRRNIILNTPNREMLGKKNDFFLNSMEIVRSGAAVGDSVDDFLNSVSVLQPRIAMVDSVEKGRSSSPLDIVDNDFPMEDGGSFPADVEAPVKEDELQSKPEERWSSSEDILPENLKRKTSIENAVQALIELDWHTDDESKRRPANIAPRRTLRVLKVLQNAQSLGSPRTRRKNKKMAAKGEMLPVFKFCDDELFSHASKFPKDSNKLPTCPSFHDQFYEEFKRRKIILQGIKGQLKVGPVRPGENDQTSTNDDEDDIMDFGVDVNFDNDDKDDVEDDVFPVPQPQNVEINNNGRTSTGDQSDLNSTETFEELIRKHTEAFITATNERARSSSISKKVKLWEESLLPVLEEEETRPLFDIQDYSTRVLNKFSPNRRKQTLAFSAVGAREPPYEVARLFVASLHLANNYNIDIHSSGEGSQRINQMAMTLLSRQQRSDTFDS